MGTGDMQSGESPSRIGLTWRQHRTAKKLGRPGLKLGEWKAQWLEAWGVAGAWPEAWRVGGAVARLESGRRLA